MAAQEHSSTRRRVLGAAAALPVLALTGLAAPLQGTVPERGPSPSPSAAEARWNRRLARYRHLHARWLAEAETGAFRQANDRSNRERADLIARFGSWEKARKSRIGKPLCRAAFARVSEAENAHYDNCTAPMYKAARRLIGTPIPAHPERASSEAEKPCRRTDLLALLAKIEIIREHELETFEDRPVHSLEALRADIGRLAVG